MAAVCKALMTGHDGSMTTIHAEDAELALDQAVQYVMENARFAGNEKMARRIVEQAIHVVIHLANQDGRRRVTGVLAVERGGNHKWVYRQGGFGWLGKDDRADRQPLAALPPSPAPPLDRRGATPVTLLALVAQLPVLLVIGVLVTLAPRAPRARPSSTSTWGGSGRLVSAGSRSSSGRRTSPLGWAGRGSDGSCCASPSSCWGWSWRGSRG